jgi:predicted nucleotidyltransferase component of viral defense system
MISKRDILDRAAEWQLRPEVVEKDYLLGWLLYAIGAHDESGRHWVFKGGTCLKKCYVETYRFSEDLDFTLTAAAQYDSDRLRVVLGQVASLAEAASGIQFASDDLSIRERKNKQGEVTYEGRLAYRGPLAFPGEPKVRFDITRFETIALAPERRGIFHPYPDALPVGSTVSCYPLDEVVAEKTRALLERTRPRDLYDVVLILENHTADLNLVRVREVLEQKCAAKGLPLPTRDSLLSVVRSDGELASEWQNMLGHQLPALPELAALLDRLPDVLEWLDEKRPAIVPRRPLASASVGASAPRLVAPRSSTYWGVGQPLEAVRFAGTNRLMIEFDYHGRARVVEPYSLRRPATGNLLLYAHEIAAGHVKAFKVSEMRNVRVASQAFTPRWAVEFTR